MMTIIFYLKKIGNLLPQKILDFQNIASTMKSNIQTSNKIMSLQRKFKTHMNKLTLIKNQRVILHLIKNINLKNQIAILHTNKHIK
jgi:DNA-binding transcriptional regulator/RsmH inhibitor MraZ